MESTLLAMNPAKVVYEEFTIGLYQSLDKEPRYQTYQVPFEKGMSAMTALDYIYQNLDSTLSYYDHAGCDLGICARCTGIINGKPCLFCQIVLEDDVTLEPVSKSKLLKDLVIKKRGKVAY